MKNSEWGAVAYLVHSKYGRNGTEVSMNKSGYYTGGGEGTAYNNSEKITSSNKFTVGDVSHTGDGIHEVYVNNSRSWFNDYSSFVNYNSPILTRGGFSYNDSGAGIFSSDERFNNTKVVDTSFRVVCVL